MVRVRGWSGEEVGARGGWGPRCSAAREGVVGTPVDFVPASEKQR